MTNATTPNFEEWVDFCFTRGYSDFQFVPDRDSSERTAVEVRNERFLRIDPEVLGQHMLSLFRAPAVIADRYTDDQIGDAVWFLFGIASDYFRLVQSSEMPQQLQIDVVSSVATLYTDLFDRVCCKRGSDPDRDYTNELRVDCAVYMIWDMDLIEGTILFPREAPHLVEPAFGVIDTVLMRCRTSSCLISALHGLGHIRMYHYEKNPDFAKRAAKIIGRFMASRRVAACVREYAKAARAGNVQ